MSLSNIFQGQNRSEADIAVDNIVSASGIAVQNGSNITMTNGRITGLGTPTQNADATTKLYVDTAVATGGGSYLPLAGGSMTGAISMGNNQITNVGAPTNTQDATSKTYVDTLVASGVGSCLPLAGGMMTGALNMGGTQKVINVATPTNATDVATKQYVDTAVAGGGSSFLPLAGGTMSGVINMGTQKITALATPTQPTDATTKQYVDTAVATGGGSYLPLAGGTLTGALTISNNSALSVSGISYLNGGALLGGAKVTGLGAPTQPTDATTKSYVDTAVATGGGAYLPLAGGTLTGGLVMSNNVISAVASPSNPQDASTKSYVDGAVGAKVSKVGDTMTGTLTIQPATAVPSVILEPAVGSSPAYAQVAFSAGVTNGLISIDNSTGSIVVDVPSGGSSVEVGGSGGGFVDITANSIACNPNTPGAGTFTVDTNTINLANASPATINIGAPKEVQTGDIINFIGGRIKMGYGTLRPSADLPPAPGMPFITITDSYFGDGTYLNLWYCRQDSAQANSGGLAIKSSGSLVFAIVNINGVTTHTY